MALPLHLLPPPLPPPSIMGAPQGVYKWPWRTAAECPPARAPAASPVSTFPDDPGKGRWQTEVGSWCPCESYSQSLPWPWRFLLELHQLLLSPVWSFECPLDTGGSSLVFPPESPAQKTFTSDHSDIPLAHLLPLSSHRAQWHGATV